MIAATYMTIKSGSFGTVLGLVVGLALCFAAVALATVAEALAWWWLSRRKRAKTTGRR